MHLQLHTKKLIPGNYEISKKLNVNTSNKCSCSIAFAKKFLGDFVNFQEENNSSRFLGFSGVLDSLFHHRLLVPDPLDGFTDFATF